MEKIRVATFNVENLFSRPKVFNFQDRSIGDELLGLIEQFRRLLKKDQYSAADKRKIKSLYLTGELIAGKIRPLKDFIVVREDRGKLWKKSNYAITGVQASGQGAWDGTIEFKKAKFNEVARENTAKVFKSVKADIACVIEAENRPSMKRFDGDLLRYRYPYEMLLDGNDNRGIDVGIYSKYPLGGIWTHMFDRVNNKTVFSRDCPEYEIFLPGGEPLYILCNHLKSKGYDSDGTADERRKNQAKYIAKILEGYDLTKDLVIVAGDLNDTPESDPLKPLLRTKHLHDVLEWKYPDDPAQRWTYHYNDFEQIDYLLVSAPLKERLADAGVERRGIYRLNSLTSGSQGAVPVEQEFSSVTSWKNQASDHGAVWADFHI